MADIVDLPIAEKNENIEKKISTTSTSASVEEGKEPIKMKMSLDEGTIGVASPPNFSVAKIVHDGKCFTPRYGHCVAEMKGLMYIYGGINSAGEVTDDMIQFVPEYNTYIFFLFKAQFVYKIT